MDMLNKVAEALQARKGDWKQIAEDSGVSYSWLTKFAQGRIQNPAYNAIVKLDKVLGKK